jgi:hypothetical protein
MNHTSGEELVRAIFDHAKGKVKREKRAREGDSNGLGKKKKRNNGGSLVAATD